MAGTADARRKGERRVAYLLFFYNILLIALFLLCTAAFLLLWRRERQAMFGWAAAAFGAYLADAVLVYLGEFVPGFARYYRATLYSEALLQVGLFLATMLCYRGFTAAALQDAARRWEWGAWLAAWPVCAAICAVPMTPLSTAVFYSLLACVGMYVAARGLLRLRAGGRPRPFLRGVLVWMTGCFAAYGAENLAWVLGGNPLAGLWPTLGQRWASIEIMSLGLGGACLVWAVRRILAAPAPEQGGEARRQAEAAEFAARYSLTRRESEVLELLLAGMNNQQIARQLYISVGTVKAHTHNIFAKTGVGDRAQLADAVRQGRNA